MTRLIPCRIPVRITALAVAVLIAASTASAHEVKLLSQRRADARRIIPVIVPGAHLAFSSPSLGFGDVILNEESTLSLDVTNTTAADTLTVQISVASGTGAIRLSVSSWTLTPGQTATLSVTYAPTVSGSLSTDLLFSSTHAGVATAVEETVRLTGQGLTPPRLELRDPTTGQLLSGVDFGSATVRTEPAPFRDVRFVNAGQAPMPDQVAITGFLGIVGGNPHGNCSMVRGNYFCFGDPAMRVPYLLADELSGLAGGASVVSRVYLFPEVPEPFSRQLSVDYATTQGQSGTLSIPVTGEIVPYLLNDPLAPVGEAALVATAGGDFVIDVMAPRLGRGRGLDKSFAGVADLDQINLFNGNLTMSIPIGLTYPVGGDLSYQLQLSYNSNVWDRWMKARDQQLFAPQAGATAGVGWSLHLGRLCGPFDRDAYRSLSREQRDRLLCRTDDFEYYSPSGGKHVFKRFLHLDDDSVITSGAIENATFLYTQNGSYIRMRRVSATIRELEFPGGTIHKFERKELSTWNDGWPDLWRITQIRDRNGNAVNIFYDTTRGDGQPGIQWRLQDGHRTHYIRLAPMTFYYGFLVDKVDLAAFGGARAVYSFAYANRTVEKPFEGPGSGGGTVTAPVLSILTLPDQSKYVFDYYTTFGNSGKDQLRARSVNLPTGGTIEWEYSSWAQPLALACVENDIQLPGVTLFAGVHRRTVKAGLTVLDQKTYSQSLISGSGIDPLYCKSWNDDAEVSASPPKAASVTAVVAPLEFDSSGTATRNQVTLSHFSVFPITVNPARNGILATPVPGGGWTAHELGLPFTRNVVYDATAPAGEKEFLSLEVYECGVVNTASGPTSMVSGCTRLRSHYVRYGRSPGFCAEDFLCPAVNSRKISGRDVFHDDGNKWILTENSVFDGLGHFRNTEQTANFGSSRWQKSFRNYNPPGELIADGNGITQNITLPGVWVLDTYNRHWVQGSEWTGTSDELLPKRGGERCWTVAANRLTLDRERAWATAGRGINDVITSYSYDVRGNRTREEYFGGDIQEVPGPEVSAWCSATLTSPQYTFNHTYDKGALRTSKFLNSTYFVVDRDVDPSTGLPVVERDSGGIGTTLDYDLMGRLIEESPTDVTRDDATRVLDYRLPGVDPVATPQVAFKVQDRNEPPNVFTEATVVFDALGRVFEEKERLPSGESKRRFTYTPRGWTQSVTTWQSVANFDPALKTFYTYDGLGRPLSAQAPDLNSQTMSYTGARLTQLTTSVGTTHDGGVPGTVTSTNVTITRSLDPFGRLERISTPSYATDLVYDSAGQVTSLTRSSGGVSQTRTFNPDGRGFLLSESHPEKGATQTAGTVLYSQYDARGNVGEKTDGPNRLRYRYDSAGRLRNVDEWTGTGWRVLKQLLRYTAADGSANGRLHTATRFHYLTSENTAGFPGVAGTWTVAEEYFYDDDGRVSSRQTTLTDAAAQPIGNFEQSWQYDPLGQVSDLSYPSICAAGFASCSDPGRAVSYGYTWGRLTSVTASPFLGALITYHPNGLVSTVSHDNGKVDTYTRDPKLMPRVWAISLASGQKNLGAHRYDGSGNLIRIGTHRYTYDQVGRLKEHFHSGVKTDWFGYDGFDNLTSVNGVGQGVSSAKNRVDGHSYDAAGSQTSDRCTELHYDSLALLRTHAQDPLQAGCSGSAKWVSLYTADDRRILVGGTTTGFHWTVRDLNGKILSTFAQAGPGLTRVKDYVYRGGRALSTYSGGVSRHLHTDHLGTPRAISTVSGTSVQKRDYTPFGDPLGDSFGEDLQFTAHERDLNGETLHMLARTFDSGRGRFYSTDPEGSTWNLYSYAENNPLRFVDPDGRDSDEPQGAEDQDGEEITAIEFIFVTNPLVKVEKIVFFTIAEAGLALGASVGGVVTTFFDTVVATPMAIFVPGMEDQLDMSLSQPGFYLPVTDKLAAGVQEGATDMLETEAEVLTHGGFWGLSSHHAEEDEEEEEENSDQTVDELVQEQARAGRERLRQMLDELGMEDPPTLVPSVFPVFPPPPPTIGPPTRRLCYDSVDVNCGREGFQEFD